MLEKNNDAMLEELKEEDCFNESNKPFIKEVVEEFKFALNALWNKLPIDSIIATFLDPRVRVLNQIPKKEQDEAIRTMARVCLSFVIHFFILLCFSFEGLSNNFKEARCSTESS